MTMLTFTLLINHLVQVAWNIFKGGTSKDVNTKPVNTSINPPIVENFDRPVIRPESISVADSKRDESGTSLNSSRVEKCEPIVVKTKTTILSRRPPSAPVNPTLSAKPTVLYNQVEATKKDIQVSRDKSREEAKIMASMRDNEEMLSALSLQTQPEGEDEPPSMDDWTPVKSKPRRGRRAANAISEQPIQRSVASTTAAPTPATSSMTDSSITPEMRKTNKFPFLLHTPTVEHISNSNVMFVMRGLPGSGKSTIVKLIKETYPDAVSCSADDHFLQPDGTYRFRQEGLTDAHEACQRKARAACEHNTPVIIIDNTNVRTWEMQHYVTMASQYGYTVVTVEPRTAWKKDARELARRNKHGVPEDIIRKKVQSFDEGLPLYYGWFLNYKYSNQVMETGEAYFGMTLKAFPEFRASMNQINTQGQTTMTSVYTREGSSSDRLHCTAFYANRGRAHTASAYHNQPHVTEAMGRSFTLEVVGFVFTNKTAGARIRISPKLMPLWGKDDNEGRNGRGAAASGSDSTNWRSRGGRVTDNAASYSSVGYSSAETSRFRPVVGEGSRAHLTLGYTNMSKAVQTGFDLQEVVAHEASASGKEYGVTTEHVAGATIRCYNKAFWVVYLDEPISMQTLFSGRY